MDHARSTSADAIALLGAVASLGERLARGTAGAGDGAELQEQVARLRRALAPLDLEVGDREGLLGRLEAVADRLLIGQPRPVDPVTVEVVVEALRRRVGKTAGRAREGDSADAGPAAQGAVGAVRFQLAHLRDVADRIGRGDARPNDGFHLRGAADAVGRALGDFALNAPARRAAERRLDAIRKVADRFEGAAGAEEGDAAAVRQFADELAELLGLVAAGEADAGAGPGVEPLTGDGADEADERAAFARTLRRALVLFDDRQAIAEYLSVSPSAVGRWVRGEAAPGRAGRTIVRRRLLERALACLGHPPDRAEGVATFADRFDAAVRALFDDATDAAQRFSVSPGSLALWREGRTRPVSSVMAAVEADLLRVALRALESDDRAAGRRTVPASVARRVVALVGPVLTGEHARAVRALEHEHLCRAIEGAEADRCVGCLRDAVADVLARAAVLVADGAESAEPRDARAEVEAGDDAARLTVARTRLRKALADFDGGPQGAIPDSSRLSLPAPLTWGDLRVLADRLGGEGEVGGEGAAVEGELPEHPPVRVNEAGVHAVWAEDLLASRAGRREIRRTVEAIGGLLERPGTIPSPRGGATGRGVLEERLSSIEALAAGAAARAERCGGRGELTPSDAKLARVHALVGELRRALGLVRDEPAAVVRQGADGLYHATLRLQGREAVARAPNPARALTRAQKRLRADGPVVEEGADG